MVEIFKESGYGKIIQHNQGARPVMAASFDTTDPYVIALGEMIFWTDQLREHCLFIELLTPPELAESYHEQAMSLLNLHTDFHEETKTTALEPEAIKSLSMRVVPEAEALARFKRQLREEQVSGAVRTLVWPLFADHIAREAERFAARQKMLLDGLVEFDREEIINFYAQIMSEHAVFVAHLLDPTEVDLIDQALTASRQFAEIQREHALEGTIDPITMDVQNLIHFKTVALQGIEEAKIQSIIPPSLADHIRREAVIFNNDLKRADMAMQISPKAA